MKKMTKRIRLLLDEWDALSEKHEQALIADDVELAHKYRSEISEFMERHRETLNIPDEQMNGMRESKRISEIHQQNYKIAEANLEKARLAYEEAKQDYEETLLQMPPEGKHRTSH